MMSAIYTILVLLLSQVPIEARLGICHYGTSSSQKPLYIHLPTNVLLLLLLLVYVRVVVDEAKSPKASKKVSILEEITLTKLALIEDAREPGAESHGSARTESEGPLLFPSKFFEILLILVLFSSGAALAGYFFWQSHDEIEMVRQSVFCSIQATISGKNASLDWMQHRSWMDDMVFSLSSAIDPYIRRQNLQSHLSAPGCSLPVEEDWIYLFITLLLLPSLPFLLTFCGFSPYVFNQSGSKSSLPRTDLTVEDDTRLLPNQPVGQPVRPRKHRRPLSSSSSEFSTTSNSHTWIMPRMAFSSGNINRVVRCNESDNPSVKSDPTSNPRHRRKERRQKEKILARIHGSPLNHFPSDRVSLNSSTTFNYTSVSGKEIQVVYQVANLLDSMPGKFQELNSQLARELQECRHRHTCDTSPKKANNSAPEDPQSSATEETGESDQEEDDDSQEEDLEDESEGAESVDDEDDYEEEEDTSTLRNTTDGSTENFDSEMSPGLKRSSPGQIFGMVRGTKEKRK
uniref:Uncharacterized protein n=1 Tax=Ditylenchus dipsaci TaxID=166011 RepID=A0A915DYG4_9BILA